MVRSAHSGSILMTEGDTDAVFFSMYIDPTACQLVPAHGKERLVQAIVILDAIPLGGVLGIADSDFDPILGVGQQSPNVVYTDVHDLDLALIMSPALDAVIRELGSSGKLNRFRSSANSSVREALLSLALPVGLLRLASARHGLNLDFEGVDLSRCVQTNLLAIDKECMVRRVVANSAIPGLRPEIVMKHLQWEEAQAHPTEYVCCGPDVVEILSYGLRQTLGTQPATVANPTLIAKVLRLAYDSGYFAMTNLSAGIRAWESANAPYRVLR